MGVAYTATYERMGRHMKKRILYMGMAVMLAASMPMAAFADETVTGGGTAGTTATSTTTVISDGGSHSISGIEFTASTGNTFALDVSGSNTSVTVNGDIKAENDGARGIVTSGSSNVTVKGDVSANVLNVSARGDSVVTIEGDSKNTHDSNNIQVNSNASVHIKGNIRSENGGVARLEDDAKLTVDGDIYGGGSGLAAWGNGSGDGSNIEIKVGGDAYGKNVIADAVDGAIIVIEGNASGNRYGASASNYGSADNKTSVTIKGDLEITSIPKIGDLQYGGIMGYNGGTVTVEGAVRINDEAGVGGWAADSIDGSLVKAGSIETSAAGVASTGATVIINKDVESGEGYYNVGLFADNSTVLIGGDLKTKDAGEVFIGVEDSGSNSELAVGGKLENEGGGLRMKVDVDSEGNAVNLPEIVIGEITDPDDITVVDRSWNEVSDAAKQQVLDNIKYIVNSNPDSMEGKGSFTITKTDGGALSRDKADKYDVTSKQEQILVKIAVNEGYELGSFSAGKNNTYVRNADGSYTVTVADGGGINIEALIKAIEADPNPIKPTTFGGSNSSGGRTTVTNGTWTGSGAAANFRKADGSLAKNEWADINVNGKIYRFRFDENGNLKTGWYTDETGARYYLNEETGSYYGAMSTGWKFINGNWYYFVPYTLIRSGVSMNMGSMLMNGMTPDGFKVDANGIWIQ